jgi:hypothetical protein
MAWIGWVLAVAAIGVASWLWRELAAERAHGNELLCAKMEVDNQFDLLRAEHGSNVEASASFAAAGAQFDAPLESMRGHLERAGVQLDDYRERVKRFDEAVQYCLQPVELIFGADKATLAELMRHVEGARRKLFETRSALEKSPLHHGAGALGVSLGDLEDLAGCARGLHPSLVAAGAAMDEFDEAETPAPVRSDHENPMLN